MKKVKGPFPPGGKRPFQTLNVPLISPVQERARGSPEPGPQEREPVWRQVSPEPGPQV